jgi:hypothetical protein
MHRIAIPCALLLAACAVPSRNDAEPDRRPTGVVTGTISSASHCSSYTLYVADPNSGKTFRIEPDVAPTRRDAKKDAAAERSLPFAVEMPAGEYSVKGWQALCGSALFISQTPTAIAFSVEPVQGLYLGNYRFDETSRIESLPTGIAVTLNERTEQDIPLIRAAFPTLALTRITQAVAPGTVVENIGGATSTASTAPAFVPVKQ